jgi:hypothetical protein
MLEKPVKKLVTGNSLPWGEKGGIVMAYVFEGQGRYKDEDLDKPTFLRNRLVKKIMFKRTSNQPVETLETKYSGKGFGFFKKAIAV